MSCPLSVWGISTYRDMSGRGCGGQEATGGKDIHAGPQQSRAEPSLPVNPLMAAIFGSAASMITQQAPSHTHIPPPTVGYLTIHNHNLVGWSVYWSNRRKAAWRVNTSKADSPCMTRWLVLNSSNTLQHHHCSTETSKQGQIGSSCRGTSTACIFQSLLKPDGLSERTSGRRSQVESHLKPTGQRGSERQGSTDLLWNFIYNTAYLFSCLRKKTCRDFSETAGNPFQQKNTQFWMIIILYYQEIPFLYPLRSPLCFLPTNSPCIISRRLTCSHWLCRFGIRPTRNASDSQRKPYLLTAHMRQCCWENRHTGQYKQSSAGGSFR